MFYPVPPKVTATGHTWLLDTGGVATATEELNLNF